MDHPRQGMQLDAPTLTSSPTRTRPAVCPGLSQTLPFSKGLGVRTEAVGWAEAGLVYREGGLLLLQRNEANYRSVRFLEKLGLLLTEATDLPCWDPLQVSRPLPMTPRTPETRNITASVSNAKIICYFSIKQEALEWRRDFQIKDARPLPPSKTPLCHFY